MSTLRTIRGIMAALQPLQGSYSSGIALVRSTGPTGYVPGGSFAVPALSGQSREDAVCFVPKNSTARDGSWLVTEAGTQLPLESVQGGPHTNVPAGTPLRWVPALDGIEPISAVHTALTGGNAVPTLTSYTGSALRQVRYFKDLGEVSARSLFNAGVNDYPAAVLAWASDAPADGSSQAFYGPNATRPGRGRRVHQAVWILHLITSRLDTVDERSREGDELRDEVMRLLTDRIAVRGLNVSMDPGTQVQGAHLTTVSPTVYVEQITFGTAYTLIKRPLPETPGPQPWEWTRMKTEVPAETPTQSEINLPDQTVPMT